MRHSRQNSNAPPRRKIQSRLEASPLLDAAIVRSERDPRIVLVDARGGTDARERFEAAHLAGARFVDLERDLATENADAAHGGRHPLPDARAFASTVGSLGITEHSRVLVYDDRNGAIAAARFWWMLSALGHRHVQVLDGGLARGVQAGLAVRAGTEESHSACGPYPAHTWCRPTVGADEVALAAADPAQLVVDVRDASRFAGEHEPIDARAGHIPGAVNLPFSRNLRPDGRYLARDELASLYGAMLGDRHPSRVIVHCGSGVTACHSILAMERASLPGARLYVGSWSEWSRSGREVSTSNSPRKLP